MAVTPARRIPADNGRLPPGYVTTPGNWQPGDYCGPLLGYTGDRPCVMYRLPDGAFGHVTSPPHSFRECADGSLEIRPSILHLASTDADPDPPVAFHGSLDEGHHWRV